MQLLWILLINAIHVLANTEIVNFAATDKYNHDIFFVHDWPTLNSTSPSLRWNLTANPLETTINVNQGPCPKLYHWNPAKDPDVCPRELWVVLDVDVDAVSWSKYSKFTLRASWPASFPVEVYIKIFDPTAIAPLPRPGPPRRYRNRKPRPSHTRRKFARIQLVNTGVLTPGRAASDDDDNDNDDESTDPLSLPGPVPLILTLEPLLFGVLPASLVPTLYALGIAAILGFFVARAVIKYLGNFIDGQKGQGEAKKA